MNFNRLGFDKIFFHTNRVAEYFTDGDCFPLQGIFGITNSCDHRCVWCYPIYIGKTRDTIYMADTGKFKAFLLECKKLGMKSYMLVGSGEPTLHPDFVEILDYSKKIGLDIGLYTNGFQLKDNDKMSSVLRNCTYVRISLDAGTIETHEKLHGIKGHFPVILENIRNLVKQRTSVFPTIGVQIATNKDNCHELPLLAHICKQVEVDYLSIKPVYSDIITKHQQEDLFDEIKIKEFMKAAEAYSSEKFCVYAKYEQFEAAMQSRYNNGTEYEHCQGTPFILFADGDGSVYICPNRTLKFGNYLDDNLEEIWNGPERRQIISSINLNQCPAGCHLHPLNKILWNIKNPDPALHPNFL
ncbi:MAG: radical SAM protein [Desulfuromonadaceae bacterium]|nr:radical SAM protein [Desulfuromonadaceae bacterium]